MAAVTPPLNRRYDIYIELCVYNIASRPWTWHISMVTRHLYYTIHMDTIPHRLFHALVITYYANHDINTHIRYALCESSLSIKQFAIVLMSDARSERCPLAWCSSVGVVEVSETHTILCERLPWMRGRPSSKQSSPPGYLCSYGAYPYGWVN